MAWGAGCEARAPGGCGPVGGSRRACAQGRPALVWLRQFGWTTPTPSTTHTCPHQPPLCAPPRCRRLSIRTHASHGAAAELGTLATYQFAQRRAGATAEWFQQAVRDIVKHVEREEPFLQTVQLGAGAPRLATYGVHESVVAAPEVRRVHGTDGEGELWPAALVPGPPRSCRAGGTARCPCSQACGPRPRITHLVSAGCPA